MANTSTAIAARATIAKKLAAFDAAERAELEPLEAAIDAAAAALEQCEYLKRRRGLEQARLAHSNAAARLESERLSLRAQLFDGLSERTRARIDRLRREVTRRIDGLRSAPDPERLLLVTRNRYGETTRDHDEGKLEAENDRLNSIWAARASQLRGLTELGRQLIEDVPLSVNPEAALSAIAEQMGKLSLPIEEHPA